jgi:LemA protein
VRGLVQPRIRTRGLDAFGSLEKHLRTFHTLLQTHVAGGAALQLPVPHTPFADAQAKYADDADSATIPAQWTQLVSNVLALDSAYKAARLTPLNQAPLTHLALAIAAVQTEWLALRDEPADLAGSPVPDAMRQQWDEASVRLQSSRDAFNQIMSRYNEALHQFPARLVVAAMGFQPAATL